MNPQIDNLETKNETLLFTISGVDVCFVNSIRRILLSNIKSFVFRTFPYEESKAEIITNTTRFNNEILNSLNYSINFRINFYLITIMLYKCF